MGYLTNKYVIIAVIMASLMAYGWFEHNRFMRTKAEFGEFIAAQHALSMQAESERIKKETEYRERLKTAEFARDAAMRQLREHQKRADLSRMSFLPATTENRICFDKSRLEQAIGILVTDLQGIAEQGDIALIDLQTVLSGWPQ